MQQINVQANWGRYWSEDRKLVAFPPHFFVLIPLPAFSHFFAVLYTIQGHAISPLSLIYLFLKLTSLHTLTFLSCPWLYILYYTWLWFDFFPSFPVQPYMHSSSSSYSFPIPLLHYATQCDATLYYLSISCASTTTLNALLVILTSISFPFATVCYKWLCFFLPSHHLLSLLFSLTSVLFTVLPFLTFFLDWTMIILCLCVPWHS